MTLNTFYILLLFCQPIWPFWSVGQAIQCLHFPLQWPQALHSLPQVPALIWRKMCCVAIELLSADAQIVQVVPRGQPKKFTCKLEVGIAIWQHKQGHDFI